MNILLVDSNVTTQKSLKKACESHSLLCAADAQSAVEQANSQQPDVVILELRLGSHSGLEFLYEFRTYADWQHIPVIVYTTVKLTDEVLMSQSWTQLDVFRYIYKPEASLQAVVDAIDKVRVS